MPIAFDLQVIHGAAGVWPVGHTTVSADARVDDPTTAPVLGILATGGEFDPPGDYSFVYTWVSQNGETLPSPPATVTLPTTEDRVSVTVPAFPPRVTGVRVYAVSPLGGPRRLARSATVSAFVANVAPVAAAAVEPTANTTGPVPLRWGRADDESGNVPVPVPQVAPTSAYSWPKTLRASVAPNGTAATIITNLAVGLAGAMPAGVRLFARTVPGAVEPTAVPSIISNVGAGPYLAAGNWRVAYTYVTDAGETAPYLVAGAVTPATFAATGSHVYSTGALTLPTTNPLPIRLVRWYVAEAVESTVLRLYAENGGEAITLGGPGTGVTPPIIGGYLQASGAPGTTMGLTPPNDPHPRAGSHPNTPSGYTPVETGDEPLVWDSRAFSGGTAGPIGFPLSLVVGVADKSSLPPTVGLLPLPDLVISFDEQ